MKIIQLLLFLFLTSVLSARDIQEIISTIQSPRKHNSWIVDEPEILGTRTSAMNKLIQNLESTNGSEIAVVILNSIDDNIPKDFAVELFNTWRIGKKDKDNGLLILHILDQRRIEIETGYGTESVLPDVKCKWIIEEIAIPFFKKSSFADGHYEMLRAVIRGIENPDIKRSELISGISTEPGKSIQVVNIPPQETIDSTSPNKKNPHIPLYTLLIGIIGMLTWGIILLFIRPRKNPRKAYEFINHSRYPHYLLGLILSITPVIWEIQNFDTFWSLPTLGGFFLYLLYKTRKKLISYTRSIPRVCNQCGKTMTKLTEEADDSELSKGQITEEIIDSIDYDVWVCTCGNKIIEDYISSFSSYSKCPSCKFRTWGIEKSVVITAATTSHSGLKHVYYRCKNCGHNKMEAVTIPKISTSSSSGGSSGGGSFGGGRSGGGGAGGSY